MLGRILCVKSDSIVKIHEHSSYAGEYCQYIKTLSFDVFQWNTCVCFVLSFVQVWNIKYLINNLYELSGRFVLIMFFFLFIAEVPLFTNVPIHF